MGEDRSPGAVLKPLALLMLLLTHFMLLSLLDLYTKYKISHLSGLLGLVFGISMAKPPKCSKFFCCFPDGNGACHYSRQPSSPRTLREPTWPTRAVTALPKKMYIQELQ